MSGPERPGDDPWPRGASPRGAEETLAPPAEATLAPPAEATLAPPAEATLAPPAEATLAPPAAGAPPGAERFGPFEVLGEISRGGQGRVLRARHRELGKLAAIKLLHASHPIARERFRRERQVLTRLEHRNLPQVLASGERDGEPWVAIELIQGQSLEEHARHGAPERAWTLRVLATVARALEHCHRLGVIHRDVKPANVVVEAGSQRPVLIDFGLARLDPEAQLTEETLKTISLTGEVIGTPAFMAPEQVGDAQGNQVGPTADVYGLGATLYFMLTGAPPFAGGAGNVLYQVLRVPPPDPRTRDPSVPAWLAEVCLQALAKDPIERLPSAAAFADALEREGAGIAPRRRRGSLGPSAVFAGLALLAAGLIAFWPGAPEGASAGPAPTRIDPTPTRTDPTPTPAAVALPPGQARWSRTLAVQGVEGRSPQAASPYAVLRAAGRWHAFDTRRGDRAPDLLLPDRAERVAWDPFRERLWVHTRPAGLLAVDASGEARELRLEVPPTRGIAADAERLYLVGHTLRAIDVQGAGRVLWSRPLPARVDHDPLLLDLDDDGAPEHLFLADCAGEAWLYACASGERVARLRLPGTVTCAPTRDGRRLLVACTEGALAWVDPASASLRLAAQLDLPDTLSSSPAPLLRGGALEAVAVTGECLGLVAVSPTLDRVLWASGPPGPAWRPRGDLVAVDLDGDGLDELACGWRQGDERLLWVCDAEGRGRLTLEGDRALPSPIPGLVGAAPLRLTAWGPFTALPEPEPSTELLGRSLLAGAADATRRHARALGADAWAALADHVLDRTPLPPHVDVRGTVAAFRRERRLPVPLQRALLAALGVATDPPPGSPGRPVEPGGPWAGGPPVGVRFHDDRLPDINGLTLSSSAREVPQRLGFEEGLELTFRQERAGPLVLVLEHRALRNDGWGFAGLEVMADGQTLIARWAPPEDEFAQERLALGDLPAGVHTLVIQVQPRSRTFYQVESLWIEGTR